MEEQKSSLRQKPFWERQADPCEERAPSGPLVLVTHSTKGTRISALGADGFAEGLWLDMKLNDARAMLPHIRVETHDLAADEALQRRLAHWMMRYSPAVCAHGRDGFALDVAGCTHLFGGEAAMAKDIEERFARMGFACRLAFADTFAAALALVFHGREQVHMLPPGAALTMLDNLPVDALRLDEETLTPLKRLGLKRIGHVRPLPRMALERRFRETTKGRAKSRASGLSQSVQWRLDQLYGAMAEPLPWIEEPQAFRVTKPCPALALETGAIEIALHELLPALCDRLQKAGKGARQFRLTGYRADGGVSSVTAGLSAPTHEPPMIARLFKDRLDQIDCGFGIDLFVMEALNVSEQAAAQYSIIEAENAAFSLVSLSGFADVMANRSAGHNSVSRFAPCPSHVPERAQRFVPVNTAVNWRTWQDQQPVWAPRPLRLLPRPEAAQVTAELPDAPPVQFIWRKRLRKVVRARGPERILPEWWRDTLKTKRSALFRDYYDVEDANGLRYWIFRAIKDELIIDSDETQRVIRWYVHGLF
ncbi:MAG: DNA polymerase Y family protein [Pseudomonadota bacterium]